MDRIKYDSLYKFIVSIGIACIILPFFMAGWLLKNQESIFITDYEINQLTDTAREIVLMEQDYKYIIISHPITCCVIIAIWVGLGLVIMTYGIVKWKKVQEKEDESKELSNALLMRQIRGLSTQETQQKVKEEIIEIETKVNEETVNNIQTKIENYIDIENYVFEIIKRYFHNYNVLENVKIGQQQIDCIALKKSDKMYDYIFEIKYIKNIESIKNNIEKIMRKMLEVEQLYYYNSKRFTKTYVVLILKESCEEEKIFNKRYLDFINKKYSIELIVSDRNNIEKDIKRIRKI